jgi:hypothetical protein
LVLRQFCRVYLEKVPDDTTLPRWANVIEPSTLALLNERVAALARDLKVTRGRKLRLDEGDFAPRQSVGRRLADLARNHDHTLIDCEDDRAAGPRRRP